MYNKALDIAVIPWERLCIINQTPACRRPVVNSREGRPRPTAATAYSDTAKKIGRDWNDIFFVP